MTIKQSSEMDVTPTVLKGQGYRGGHIGHRKSRAKGDLLGGNGCVRYGDCLTCPDKLAEECRFK